MPDLQTAPEQSLTGLVSGIIDDTQRLLKQQVDLIRSEVQRDLRQAKDAAGMVGVGAGMTGVGVLLLALAMVQLVRWAFEIPEWAAYASVGGAIVLIGGGLLYAGVRMFRANNPLPEQSVQALEENVAWLTNNNRK